MRSRRTFLAAMGAAAYTVRAGLASAQAAALPLDNLGLEHLDIVVPDPAASAKFYARIFKTALHQQPVRDTLRYFVLLGDLPADRQVGYIAIGAAAGRPPSIGHYCTLAKMYDRAGMGRALEAAGFSGIRGAGGLGMWPDPDGLELQLFQPPAGLVTAAVPSPLPVDGEGLVTPIGVDHVLLHVSDLERSLPYYRLVYGAPAEGPRNEDGRVWFRLERNTRIGLQKAPAGETPRIAHVAIKVAAFDRGAAAARLRQLGVKVVPSPEEPDVLRFLDIDGIVVELKVVL
jgi:catechol 2,3-dioxygenase-like lactoylglutathione lyase family enzyme